MIGLKILGCIPFEEGLGLVSLDNKTGFINKTGEIAIPLRSEDGESFRIGEAESQTE